MKNNTDIDKIDITTHTVNSDTHNNSSSSPPFLSPPHSPSSSPLVLSPRCDGEYLVSPRGANGRRGIVIGRSTIPSQQASIPPPSLPELPLLPDEPELLEVGRPLDQSFSVKLPASMLAKIEEKHLEEPPPQRTSDRRRTRTLSRLSGVFKPLFDLPDDDSPPRIVHTSHELYKHDTSPSTPATTPIPSPIPTLETIPPPEVVTRPREGSPTPSRLSVVLLAEREALLVPITSPVVRNRALSRKQKNQIELQSYYSKPLLEIMEDHTINTTFSEPDNEKNVVLVTKENPTTGRETIVVKAGTLDKLIERLTYPKEYENDYLYAFLLTYRSFTTPEELLERLIYRYNTPPIPNEDPDVFYRQILTPIRLRVFQVIRSWVDYHFHDFDEDKALFTRLQAFIDSILTTNSTKEGVMLKMSLTRKIQSQRTQSHLKNKGSGESEPPKPKMPIGLRLYRKVALLHWSATEIARQLTLIDAAIYSKIQPKECLNQAWNKKDRAQRDAPNITAMINRTNIIGRWVADEIISCGPNVKDRLHAMRKFIKIAWICKELGNFNTAFGIMGGLSTTPIIRLKKSWQLLKKEHEQSISQFESLEQLTDPNKSYKEFRDTLTNMGPPCVPYLGMFLTDLTFIEDGNKDFTPEGLINFSKRQLLSVVIREIQLYQQVRFNLVEVPELRDKLLGLNPRDLETLYHKSLEVEPRAERRRKTLVQE